MSTRRSRPPRSRKSPAAETSPQGSPSLAALAATLAAGGPGDPLRAPSARPPSDPTETSQLRALEAGWDERLP